MGSGARFMQKAIRGFPRQKSCPSERARNTQNPNPNPWFRWAGQANPQPSHAVGLPNSRFCDTFVTAGAAARPGMDDADDKEREALLLRSKTSPRFHYDDWRRWLSTRYRQPLDPHKIEDFWWRSDDKIVNDAWLADLFALPNWSLLSHYVNIGISLMMGATPVTYYLVETLSLIHI